MSSDRTVDIDWPTCDQDGCIGVRLQEGTACLAHATAEAREAALKQLGDTGELDARGVPVAPALLEEILAAAPQDAKDRRRPTFIVADFRRATFKGGARFIRVSFQRDAYFANAIFEGNAVFTWATFHQVGFGGVTFQQHATFTWVTFKRDAWFEGVTFQGAAGFDYATFHGDGTFSSVAFGSDVVFTRAIFWRNASFNEARFHKPVELGPIAVAGWLELDGVVFDQPVQLEAAARRLSCQRARFRAGGYLRVAWAEISFQDAEVSTPLILSWQSPNPELAARVPWLTTGSDAPDGFPEPLPSLVSVRRADVAGLVVADIDLRECRFAGAHHLDQFQFATAVRFLRAPAWHGRGRQVLAEECQWRRARGSWRRRRWRQTTAELFRPRLTGGTHQPHPTELARIYRQCPRTPSYVVWRTAWRVGRRKRAFLFACREAILRSVGTNLPSRRMAAHDPLAGAVDEPPCVQGVGRCRRDLGGDRSGDRL
jgi:uncharacterized protein YjbI with pentapeptide repeats